MEIRDEMANIPLDIYQQVIDGFTEMKKKNRFVIAKTNEYDMYDVEEYYPYETDETKEEILNKVDNWIKEKFPNLIAPRTYISQYMSIGGFKLEISDFFGKPVYDNGRYIGQQLDNEPLRVFTIDEWFEYMKEK